MSDPKEFVDVVGPHPVPPDEMGECFSYEDGHSSRKVPTRSLKESSVDANQFLSQMREWIRIHHARPEDLERDRRRREALKRQGFSLPTSRFPIRSTTQKGNWAEIFLCEYIASSCAAELPIYRLRYNPNVNQSMKGDDVLAFDLDSDPIRVIVGEAKFRSTPSKRAVEEIIEGLERSYGSGLPVSLQFIADRLYQEGKEDLGQRIEECANLFALGQLRLDHVGLLASNLNTPDHVKRNAASSLRHLAVISLSLSDGPRLVAASFDSLEEST